MLSSSVKLQASTRIRRNNVAQNNNKTCTLYWPSRLRLRLRLPCYNKKENNLSHSPSLILTVPFSSNPHTVDASEPSISSHLTQSVGSPSTILLHLTHNHILFLNLMACAVAVSTTWLFVSAIPALLAFKRAAESLQKLMDVAREELPDTMAAVRLSGMEISDLTMELTDLGQELTRGVRSSTRAVRAAEERLRGFTNATPSASLQRVGGRETEAGGPALARSARNMRESIVKGRSMLQAFFSLSKFLQMALTYFKERAKR